MPFKNPPPKPPFPSVAVSDTVVPPQYENGHLVKITKTDAEWKTQLTEMEYYVLRQKGTERLYGRFVEQPRKRHLYSCAACGLPCSVRTPNSNRVPAGHPFTSRSNRNTSPTRKTTSLRHGARRGCLRCGGHSGHVFPDGLPPTGLRYCINSVSLNFVKQ